MTTVGASVSEVTQSAQRMLTVGALVILGVVGFTMYNVYRTTAAAGKLAKEHPELLKLLV